MGEREKWIHWQRRYGTTTIWAMSSNRLTVFLYWEVMMYGLPKEVLRFFWRVGDLQRIKLYPEMGFQMPQEIPWEVWDAYAQLVRLGYDMHLIKEGLKANEGT